MELLVGALAIVALIAIAIRFAPRNASGGMVLPRVVDDSIGMWGIRAVTRRLGGGPNDVDDEVLDDIPLDTLEARLDRGRRSDVPAPVLEPRRAAAASVAATVPARAARPPSVVQASAEPELAETSAEPDAQGSPNGQPAVEPESNGTGPGGNGTSGKRPRRRKGTSEPAGKAAPAPSESDLRADDTTVEAGLAAAVTTADDAGPMDPGAPPEPIAHDAPSTNGSALAGLTNGAAASGGLAAPSGPASGNDPAGTTRSAPEVLVPVSSSFPALGRTSPLVVGSRPIGTWSKSPDSLPNSFWGSTATPARSTDAAVPTSGAPATSGVEPEASASDDQRSSLKAPLPPAVRTAPTKLGLSVRSMSILVGAILLVVALVLAAQVDKKHEAVLGATGLPGDGVAVGSPPPASDSAAPSAPAKSGAPGKSPRPTVVPSPVAPPSAPPPTGMPFYSRSALVQAILLDQRLTDDRTALRTALAASPFDASAVAAILRNVSADSVYGLQLTSIILSWQPAEPYAAGLRDLYTAIHQEANDALIPSVQLTSAYRQSAKAMVNRLAAVQAVDDRARALASANGEPDPGASAAP